MANLHTTTAPRLRSFTDPIATRQAIYSNVLEAARSVPPIANTQHSLSLEDVDYEGPEDYSLSQQKQAVLAGTSLGRRLRGTWVLKDPAGQVLEKKRATLAQVPHLTQRGTFIVNGSEYSLGSQLRLRPGVYIRRKESGETESHINILPGKGLSHRYLLEPATGVFKLHVGQASLPLFPVLSALGATKEELTKHWGSQLYAVNATKNDSAALDKLYTRLLGRRAKPGASPLEKQEAVHQAITTMELDPEVTTHTLGQPFTHLTKDAVLTATSKVLAVARGEAEAHDRDHLAFQHIWGPEDLFAERFHRDNGILRKLLWQVSHRKSLDRVPAGVFTKHVQGALLDSGLGQALEEVNPVELLDHQSRVSKLGVGGLPSLESVPAESRSVHPSQLGFIDLVRTPESLRAGLDTRTSYASSKGSDKRIYTPYTDARTGKIINLSPQTVAMKTIAFPDELEKNEPFVAALVQGRPRVVPRRKVDLILPHMENAFSPLSNLVPLKSMSKGQRISMGSRFLTQALPLVNPESPWLQGGVPGQENTSFEELFGRHMGAVHAETAGKVTQITPDHIVVQGAGGRHVHELYNNHPFNRKTLIHNTPVIQVGQTVQPGQLLARSNFTDDKGVAAPGLNARTAFIPFRGLNHDDAIVVSSDMAKRLCFDTETEILTNRGWLRRSDLTLNDLAAGLVDGRLVYQEVRAIHDHTTNELIAASGKQFDIAVTPEHSLYVSPSKKRKFEKAIASELVGSRRVRLLRTATNTQPDQEFFYVPTIVKKGNQKNPGFAVREDRVITELRLNMDDWCVLFGLWVAEGWTDNPDTTRSPQVIIKYDKPRVEKVLREVTARLGVGCFSTVKRWSWHSLQAVKYLRPLSNGDARAKYLPDWVWSLSQRQARLLLHGIMLGDGSFDKMEIGSIFTSSRQLRDDIQRLALHCGYSANWYVAHLAGDTSFMKDGRKVTATVDNYRIGILGPRHAPHLNHSAETSLKTLYLNEPASVWCVTTITGLVYVRRNGKPRWCGNSSEHAYQHVHEWDEHSRRGKKAFTAIFPGTFDRDRLGQLDDEGVITPGSVVHHGDPLVLSARERVASHQRVHSAHKGNFQDASLTWDHHDPGVITDVIKTLNGVNVVVKSYQPMRTADKLSGRHGNKGIVNIVKSEEMPHDEQGRPFEVLLDPEGIISRSNPSQVAEAVLGKIAAKRGQPYKVTDFSGQPDMMSWVYNEARKHGVSDTETLTDPTTGRKIPGVLTGNMYFLKLMHTAECFDDATDVLTIRGWVPWTKIRDDDVLATIENGKIIYERPLKIIRQYFEGVLYCYRGRYLDYAVTGSHRLWARNPQKGKPFKFVTAEQAHGHAWVVQQFGFIRDSYADSTLVRVADRWLWWIDYAELVGWWVTEGYAKVGKNSGFVTLYQSGEVNPGNLAKMEALAERLSSPWRPYRVDGKKAGVTLRDRALAIHLKSFGTHCYNKRLPRLLFSSPIEARRRLFEIMLDGDGNRQATATGPRHRFTSTSKGLADDFQELCISIGKGAVVHRDAPRKESHYLQSWTCGVALSRTDASIDPYRNRFGFTRVDYSGKVYCAEMRTGILYVRRNGKPMVSGNSKSQGRGLGSYTANEEPARGGHEGAQSKRLALMNVHALLAHSAVNVLRDARLIRGQKNQEYWAAVMNGMRPSTPTEPLVYRKFLAQLQGAGIHVRRQGSQLHLGALTDRDIDVLAAERNLENAETVDWQGGLKAIPGGLFDVNLTGGHGSQNRWSAIKLHEPFPNPVFEDPIRHLLKLTKKQYEDVIAGKHELVGRTGPRAIQEALTNINVSQALNQARADIASGRKTLRDAAVRRLSYLRGAETQGIHPKDWILSRAPVLPPLFRPVSIMQNQGGQLVSDANLLYKDLFDANHALAKLSEVTGDVGSERLNVYHALKAVTGLGDPVSAKNKERRVSGLLASILGSSPKFGQVQQKLLGSTMDLVGRSVIVPNPDLDIDHIGLPENHAWDLFTPFIIGNLVKRGVPRLQAMRALKERNDLARKALLEELDHRPVIVDRAPVLHKYGLMAFKPVLMAGDQLHVCPLVYKGYGADNDGDMMNFHVVATEEAREEALDRMLPSKNLISVADFKRPLNVPDQQYLVGLHEATRRRNEGKRPRVFATTVDALAAFRRGELDAGDPVEVVQTD